MWKLKNKANINWYLYETNMELNEIIHVERKLLYKKSTLQKKYQRKLKTWMENSIGDANIKSAI